MYRTFFIILLSLIKFPCHAQSSIFERDTVAFCYYVTDEKDEIVSSINDGEESSLDTFVNWRYIFVDNKKIVHWRENGKNVNPFYYHFFLEKIGLTDSSDNSIPLFKVVRDGINFKYQTIETNPKTIFKASLSKRGIRKAPFFLPWSIIHGVPREIEFEGLNFIKDTLLNINGKLIKCYHFSKFETNFPYVTKSFWEYYTEIFFEKSSLLPVLISRRSLSRYYNNDELNDGTKIGYTLLYFHMRIEPRLKR